MATEWQPRPDQVSPLKFILERSSAGLFMTPGFGKTAISLANAAMLLEHNQAKRVLVIAPLRPMAQVWPQEFSKWSDFNHMTYSILHGPKKAAALAAKTDVALINPEGLPWLFAQARKHRQFDAVVFDESTKFKNSQSARFKLMRAHISEFKYRYLLSGTPRPRSLENLFSQIYLLDNGLRLGQYISHFRRQFMFDTAPKHANWSEWVPMPGAETEVYRLISDICLTLTDDDFAGAPPFIENPITVCMPQSAKKQYTDMLRTLMADIRGKIIAPKNAGARAMKLRQIASGFIYDDDAKGTLVHTAKLDALVDLIESLDGAPLLVCVAFRYEYEMIAGRLAAEGFPLPPYLGQGGVTASKTQSVIDAWNNGTCPVIVAHPASAGHGIDGLQHSGSDVCFYSLTHDFELYDQVRRRLKRPGQKKPTVIHYLETEGTFDADIRLLTINQRQQDQTAFFRALCNHVEKRK